MNQVKTADATEETQPASVLHLTAYRLDLGRMSIAKLQRKKIQRTQRPENPLALS